jgi:hypothetical protein
VPTHHVLVDHDRPVLAERAHRQLAVPRNPELSHQDHVDRCTDGAGDLHRDRDATAGQADDDGRAVTTMPGKAFPHLLTQALASVDPIVEHDPIVPLRPSDV